ncbi:hypothetical protein [Streptomyces sp. NPDC050504]|uniref:hypothetical protein n=1 Tax=Streptomyces sp. NPDC050504 TaxID=3365618 RepID=UPI0037BA7184
MNGLELLVWLVIAYLIGRIHQWHRSRKANEVGHHLGRAFDAMQKRKDNNK